MLGVGNNLENKIRHCLGKDPDEYMLDIRRCELAMLENSLVESLKKKGKTKASEAIAEAIEEVKKDINWFALRINERGKNKEEDTAEQPNVSQCTQIEIKSGLEKELKIRESEREMLKDALNNAYGKASFSVIERMAKDLVKKNNDIEDIKAEILKVANPPKRKEDLVRDKNMVDFEESVNDALFKRAFVLDLGELGIPPSMVEKILVKEDTKEISVVIRDFVMKEDSRAKPVILVLRNFKASHSKIQTIKVHRKDQTLKDLYTEIYENVSLIKILREPLEYADGFARIGLLFHYEHAAFKNDAENELH